MKRFFFSCFLIMMVLCAGAQLSYGVKAGLTASKETFTSGNYETTPRIGFHAGLAARYAFLEALALQAELLYSLEGSREEGTNGTKGQINRSFVHLPVAVQYLLIKKLQAEAGLQFGYMVKAEEKYGATSYHDISEYYKKTDLRWLIGLAYALNRNMVLNARFTRSFSPIIDAPVGGGDLKPMALYLGFLYLLK